MHSEKKIKIAILGTRGIPNHYGGFEQCAEYLALGLINRGFEVYVYNSHNHPYQHSEWNQVKIIHCYDPEEKFGTVGQFIYDLNCILDIRKRNVDIILQLGYTSSSVWGRLLPKKAQVITNMDGLEWKRTKYPNAVKRFLKYAEYLGIKFSDHLVSDSIGIQKYIFDTYKEESTYIPYGANLFTNSRSEILKEYGLDVFNYNVLIARLEPENSIEVILEGVVKSTSSRKFLVIGKNNTKYGKYLMDKFTDTRVVFLGGIYDIEKLNNIRYYSNVYFHGHTVGGTNPSLLEAMASNSLICAQNNPFNQYILEGDAFYFNTSSDISAILDSTEKASGVFQLYLSNNTRKIESKYSWETIVDQYAKLFVKVMKRGINN